MRDKDNWPERWDLTTLDEVVERITNGINLPQLDLEIEKSYPISRIETIANESIDFNRVKYVLIDEDGLKKYSLQKGDILFSHINSDKHLGKTAIYNDDSILIHGVNLLLIRANSKIDKKLFNYLFRHYRFQGKFIDVAQRAVNQSSINQKKLKEFTVPLITAKEQQRIVAKLDAIFGHLDRVREKLDRIPVLLKNFRQQVLTQAVTGELTREWREENLATLDSAIVEGKKIISEKKNLYKNQTANFLEKLEESLSLELNGVFFSNDWCTIKPEFISSPEKYSIGIGPFGSNLKVSDYKTEGYPLIFVRNVIANKFDGLEPKFVNKEKFHELLAHSIKPGDLLITKMGTPPGDCKLYPESSREGIITSDILKVRIWKKYFVPKFYEYVISSKIVRTQIEAITKGVAHQKISLKRFKEIELPFPTKKEQEEIVKKVDTLFELSDKIESQYQTLKAKIDQMPQAILAKAFRGELVGREVKEYLREEGEVMVAAEGEVSKINWDK